MHPILILALIVVLLLFASWLKRAPPAARNRALVTVGIVAVLALVATGRMNWLFAALAGAVALAQRVLTATQIFSSLKSMGGTTGAKKSDVETGYLHMSLNHDTGEMSGEVVQGAYKGRSLESLSVAELMALHEACREHDQQSVAVLEAYLERRFGEEWRDSGGEEAFRTASGNGKMSRKEAFEILGIAEGAGDEEIVEAHRRLMQKLHPDRGGSNYLAAKINQAKDVLLGT